MVSDRRTDGLTIPPNWREQLDPVVDWAQFEATLAFVRSERKAHAGRVYPPESEMFAALEMTPFSSVRAVILGQDPYYRNGQAHGLAFSLRAGAAPFPGSLTNILNEVEREYGPGGRDGSLVRWASEGVLLLNTALTVVERDPASHLDAWASFTDAVINAVAGRASPVVFMLWGREAEARRALLPMVPADLVQVRSHPSGRAAYRNFRRTSPFRAANESLKAAGVAEVDWTLPLP